MVTINEVTQALWNLSAEAEGLAVDLRDGAKEIYSASIALEPHSRALRELRGLAELEEGRLRSEETARYAMDKVSKSSVKSVMTAGDAAGRKAQLEAYLAAQSADPRTDLGRLTADIRKKEMEVENLTAKVKDGERQQRAQLAVAEIMGKRMDALGRILEALSISAKAV